MTRFRSCAQSALLALTLACVCQCLMFRPATAGEPREITVRRTADQVRYGLIGEIGKTPAPTLFVFAHGIDEMQREPVYTEVAGISPVTKLLALREFAATSHRAKAEQLDVMRLAPQLAGRAVWLSIGNNDARVNTDDAIAFTREVVRATARPDKPDAVIPVELLVAPTPGHSKIDQAHELLAAWLVNRFPPAKPAPEKGSR